MNRSEKEQAVEKLNRAFQDSVGVILVDFKGITVPEITELRDRIREMGGHYEVIKNRLAIRAAVETPLAESSELFAGPTAIAYTDSDSVGLAKALREFVRGHDGMEFKAGFLEGKLLSVDEVEQLAKMPSRDELLSKVMFLVQAPLTQFASALKSPLRDLASLLSQLAEHQDRPGVAAAAAESAEAEEASQDAAADSEEVSQQAAADESEPAEEAAADPAEEAAVDEEAEAAAAGEAPAEEAAAEQEPSEEAADAEPAEDSSADEEPSQEAAADEDDSVAAEATADEAGPKDESAEDDAADETEEKKQE